MDVRCERCGTEYEFDETKVTEAGVTVKCAQCGHLFKVRRRSEASIAARMPGPAIVTAPVGERMWIVRDPKSGDVQRFRELTTLQQWIVERRVSRDHEISRTGETWKPLGEIAELASFFQVVDMASRSGEHQQPPPPQPPPRANTPAPPMGPQGTLFAPPPRQPTPSPQAAYDPTMQVPASPQPYSPSPSYGRQELPVQRPSAGPDGPSSLGSIPRMQDEPNYTGIGPALEEDDFAPIVQPRWGLRVALISILGAGIGFGAYAGRNQLRALFGGKAEPSSDAMAAGRDSFRADTDDGYIQADHQFQRAQGTNPGDPKPQAALAEVYSTWAMYLREDARLLDARAAKAGQPGDAAALRARAEEKRREADQKLQQAELSAKEALAHGVEDPDVNRGYSLMEVVKGAPAAEVERFVGKAKGGEPETLFVEGALLLREQRSDEARRVLEDALARSGDRPLARVQYLLARTNETLNRKDVAKEILERLVRQNPKHDRAKALLDSLSTEVAQAPAPAPAPAPTGTQTPTPPAPSPGPAPAPAPAPGKTASAGSASESPTGGSYDQLVERGNKFLEKGQDSKARNAFEEALRQRPQGPEAQTGIGNYFVSAGKPAMAILYFQKAADNGYGEAYFYLAEAQRAQGASAEALANYRKYLAHGARGENVGIAQRAIRDLASKSEKAEAPAPSPSPAPPPEEKPKEKDLPPDPTPPKEKPPEEVKP
jgi:predicted Zn finger-like uncharacterized protein